MNNQQIEVLGCLLIVVNIFLANALTSGLAVSIGVFYIPIKDTFQQTSGVAAWIGSINYAFILIVGPFVGELHKRFGCHKVLAVGCAISVLGLIVTAYSPNIYVIFASFGVVSGTGYGFVFISGVLITNVSITRWRMTCTGISTAGVGFGGTLYPILSDYLNSYYGWRGAILIIAGLTMHVLPMAQLIWVAQNIMKPLHGKEKTNTHSAKKIDNTEAIFENELDLNTVNSSETANDNGKSIWKTPKYWAFLFNTVVFSVGQSAIYTHIPAFAKKSGISSIKSSSLLSAVGIASLFGRTFLGIAANHPSVDTEILFNASYFTAGISTICYVIWSNYVYMVICVVILGFCLGAYGPLLAEMNYIIVGRENFDKAYGYSLWFSAVGTVLGAPCAGWIYDISNNYNDSFYFSGAAFIISTFIMVCPTCCRYFLKKQIHEVEKTPTFIWFIHL